MFRGVGALGKISGFASLAAFDLSCLVRGDRAVQAVVGGGNIRADRLGAAVLRRQRVALRVEQQERVGPLFVFSALCEIGPLALKVGFVAGKLLGDLLGGFQLGRHSVQLFEQVDLAGEPFEGLGRSARGSGGFRRAGRFNGMFGRGQPSSRRLAR